MCVFTYHKESNLRWIMGYLSPYSYACTSWTPSNGYWADAGTNEVSPPLLPAEFRSLQMDSLSAIYLNEQ